MSRSRLYWASGCLLLLPMVCGCQGGTLSDAAMPAASADKAAASVPRVETVTPQRKAIRQVVEQPAQIKPYEVTPVYAKVSGYVREVNVDIGSRLRGPKPAAAGQQPAHGQVLVQLWIPEVEDDVRAKAALVAQADADVAQAHAAIGVAEAMVATAQAAVEQAEAVARRAAAAYVKWESEHGRFVQLAANGSVTEKLVDESREQLAAADASRQEAQAKQASARAGVAESKAGLAKSQADLVAAEARLHVAQAEHAKAVTLLEYGAIEAPFDGIVTRRNVHTGHLVHAGPEGEPLLILMRTDVLRVAADVPEADAGLIRAGQPVSIRLPALAAEPLTGKVSRTSGSLDVATRTLRVEIDVPNQDGRLQPGLYAYVSIIVGEHADALVLPASAILTDKNQSACLCVENGQIVRKPVTLGLHSGSEVEITAGLKGDEAVVRVNSGTWTEGQTVEAKPAPPAAL